MSRHTDIADAVVAALNGHTFSLDFTAVRKYRPYLKREEMGDDLYVTVIPATYAAEPADRARRQRDFAIDVAVQQAVDPESLTACDALADLLEDIEELFSMRRLDGLPAATWLGVETLPGADAGYALEHLDEQRVYSGFLRMKWRVIEA